MYPELIILVTFGVSQQLNRWANCKYLALLFFCSRSPHMIYIRGFATSINSVDIHRFLYGYGGHMSFYKFIPEIRTAYFVFNLNNWGGQTALTIRDLNGYFWSGCLLESDWSYAPVYSEERIFYWSDILDRNMLQQLWQIVLKDSQTRCWNFRLQIMPQMVWYSDDHLDTKHLFGFLMVIM